MPTILIVGASRGLGHAMAAEFLNQLMRSFVARPASPPWAAVLTAPGWVRTELGGPDARLGIEESVPSPVEVLLAMRGKPGLHCLDYLGASFPGEGGAVTAGVTGAAGWWPRP